MFTAHSCALVGLEPFVVTCEVSLSNQLPSVKLVGLPSSVTTESTERVRTACLNSGLEWPSRKVTINLLPAQLPKWGSHFELAMAIGILGAQLRVTEQTLVFAFGELSLSGDIRSCGWLALIAKWLLSVPLNNVSEGRRKILFAHPDDIEHLLRICPLLNDVFSFFKVRNLKEAFVALEKSQSEKKPCKEKKPILTNIVKKQSFNLLSQVKGEPLGVVSALTAIAGSYHCLLAGPHGCGKSMLLSAICEASKPLTESEQFQRSALLGAFGEKFVTWNRKYTRPTYYLQTSISKAALEGSLLRNGQVIPGEMTCGHLGIIVADEFLEFHRDVLEALRQPLEEGIIRLQRAELRTILPARFQLLASTNLCPCGYFGSLRRECRCIKNSLRSYHTKLSGPVLDRFDLSVLIGVHHKFKLSKEIEERVSALCDPKSWQNRVEHVWNSPRETVPEQSMDQFLFPEVYSERAKKKVLHVSKTLAGLLKEKWSPIHLRMALVLRQDIDGVLREKNNSEFLFQKFTF